MSRRLDIELTSSLDDGSWTWRAAGARQPKGTLDGSILPEGTKVGDELKVEVEQEIDGITILSVVQERAKQDRSDVLELLPTERDFQPVVETRAKRGKGERRPRRDGDRRPRRDRRDGDGRDRRDGERRGGRDDRGGRGGRDGRGRRGPSFTPPPEVPQRPKPKRLKPGKAHRNAVLADLPEEQRPVAELALQGLGAVRKKVRDSNEQAVKDGRATMPEQSVMKMAEEMLPKLRVAEWLDRAEAAQRQMANLDLRDLRSVVAAANDPMVARDDSTRALREELSAALVTKQEEELQLWFGDVDAALAVGRVIRALRLSSQPPKAGVPFPADIAQRLIDSTNAALAPMDSAERWSAMLEAAAFSPIRSQVQPARKPDEVNDELLATVTRLAPALPQVAALFDIEVAPDAAMPKPLRPTYGKRKGDGDQKSRGGSSKQESGKGRRARGDKRSDRDHSPDATGTPAPETTSRPSEQAAAGHTPTPDATPSTTEHAEVDATTDTDTAKATEPEATDAATTDTDAAAAPADAAADADTAKAIEPEATDAADGAKATQPEATDAAPTDADTTDDSDTADAAADADTAKAIEPEATDAAADDSDTADATADDSETADDSNTADADTAKATDPEATDAATADADTTDATADADAAKATEPEATDAADTDADTTDADTAKATEREATDAAPTD